MNEHLLNNPAWNALHSGNSDLANGTDKAVYFSPDVSPFVACPDSTDTSFEALHEVIPFSQPVVYISDRKLEIKSLWKELDCIGGYQMIFRRLLGPIGEDAGQVPLTEAHVDQMLALTKLTNPGPFLSGTINFGHYKGIFEEEKLIAMAGQRLHLQGFAEISAVCTHPDHLGKGYARQLILQQIARIQAAGEVPFLHVKSENLRAIRVYENLGFEKRMEVFFYVLEKMQDSLM